MKTRYRIAIGLTLPELVNEVSRAAIDGWKPHGSLVIDENWATGLKSAPTTRRYLQPITLEE